MKYKYKLQIVIKCYKVLQSVIKCYKVLQSVTKCYKNNKFEVIVNIVPLYCVSKYFFLFMFKEIKTIATKVILLLPKSTSTQVGSEK